MNISTTTRKFRVQPMSTKTYGTRLLVV